MQKGRHGERYLLGAVNWTFVKLFDRLERLTKVQSPRLALPSKFAITGAHVIDSLFRQWNFTSPIEADTVEMAEYFWYLNHSKARRELAFTPRDPGDTLNDTVRYVRENFLGGIRRSNND
jgi:dihydroflavonol-4-reductase